MTIRRLGSTIGDRGAKELALEESHSVDDEKCDNNCKLEEVVEKENL